MFNRLVATTRSGAYRSPVRPWCGGQAAISGQHRSDGAIVFLGAGSYQKKIPAATRHREGYCPFQKPIPPESCAPYTERGKFICNLNDMRSNMALQIGAVAPDFEAETTEGKI